MTRFYFDTFDGRRKLQDDEGVTCINRAAARREAAAALADMAQDALPDGQHHESMIQIRDGDGLWFEARLSYDGREVRAGWGPNSPKPSRS
jgi:hypothetical protein